jgi:hypothetical protein
VIFDPATSLPYIIRTVEDNAIFGISNRDLQVFNYTSVDGIMFPTRFTTLYNNAIIEDFEIADIKVNSQLPADFYNGLPANNSTGSPAAAAPQQNYTHAELGEWNDNMLYSTQYTGTLNNVSATHPAPGLDHVWRLVFKDSPGYTQLVLDFDDAVFVLDAPPHQSDLVIQWVQQNLGKRVTHLWVVISKIQSKHVISHY